MISSNLNGYKDGRRNYLSVINDQMTTKIFLPSDLRMMGGQESERDQVWATEDGILHIINTITSDITRKSSRTC